MLIAGRHCALERYGLHMLSCLLIGTGLFWMGRLLQAHIGPLLIRRCFCLLCFAVLCFALLCYALLCFAELCFTLLCYAVLCVTWHCFALLGTRGTQGTQGNPRNPRNRGNPRNPALGSHFSCTLLYIAWGQQGGTAPQDAAGRRAEPRQPGHPGLPRDIALELSKNPL